MQISVTTWLMVYVIWNVAAIILVRLDKQRSRRRGARRIRERTFFLWAAAFGAVGVLSGMYLFRHKTLHWSFVIGIPLLVIFNFVCGYYIWLV
ncbi:MAG: hypothetical protein H6Q73_4420 [Firmicutes bacterium]|nr:hypothetical protein [Bacillota bacterium]